MTLRLLLLLCLLSFTSMMFAEKLHEEGMLLCRLKNLPHRGLGMIFWAHTLQPQRQDYTRDYLVQYMIYTDGEMLLEGSTRPVVPCYAAIMARRFPNDKDIGFIRDEIMRRHFKSLEK